MLAAPTQRSNGLGVGGSIGARVGGVSVYVCVHV